MEKDTRKKIIHSAVYVCITIMFPTVPVKGLVFIGAVISGSIAGFSPWMWTETKENIKENIFDFKGPLLKINPFE